MEKSGHWQFDTYADTKIFLKMDIQYKQFKFTMGFSDTLSGN